MCAPTFYGVDYVVNPSSAGHLHRSSHAAAMEQWRALYRAVCRVADVELLEPQPGVPDLVFTAGAGLVLHGVAVLSSGLHDDRRNEEIYFSEWMLRQGFLVMDSQRRAAFEGERDALFEADGSRLWAADADGVYSGRHQAFEENWGKPVVALRLIDPRFASLQTCFCPLTGGALLYYPDAFDAESLRKIEAHYPPRKRIAVTEDEAVHFACAALNIGRLVILHNQSPMAAAELRHRGFDVLELSLHEFVQGGGSARTLALRLSDLGVTHAAPATTRFAVRRGCVTDKALVS